MAPSGPDKQGIVSLEREREKTIDVLSQHFAHDNLSLEELERRIDQVYKASSVAALRDLTKDLQADAAAVAERRAAPLPEVFAPERGRVVSVMTQTKKRGMWNPPRHVDVFCFMSETLLDLTEARLAEGVTEIHLRAVMTQVKVIVPPGVRVVVQPDAFMAEVSDEVMDPPPVGSRAPVVRITGFVFMTELKVFARTRELFD